MSPSESRALRWLLLLGAAGVLVRLGSSPPPAPGAIAYRGPDPPGGARDSVAARAARLARPLRKGEQVDLDVASAEEITRLPRIGPALAARIVDDRERNGPFGSLDGLDRVSGVGPGLLDAIRSHAKFSGHSAQRAEPRHASAPVVRKRAGARAAAAPEARGHVSLSIATAEALAHVPGIGPAKAAAIVTYREIHGPFTTVDDLDSVPGFGSVLVRRVAPFVAP